MDSPITSDSDGEDTFQNDLLVLSNAAELSDQTKDNKADNKDQHSTEKLNELRDNMRSLIGINGKDWVPKFTSDPKLNAVQYESNSVLEEETNAKIQQNIYEGIKSLPQREISLEQDGALSSINSNLSCTYIHDQHQRMKELQAGSQSPEFRSYEEKCTTVRMNLELVPEDQRVGCYDIMILYAEDDRTIALEYQSHLNDIVLENGEYIKAVLYNDPKLIPLAGSEFQTLEKAFEEHCTFAFVMLTPNLHKCSFMKACYEGCLMRTLTEDMSKQWCIKPVHVTNPKKCKFNVPYGLNSLRCEAYYRRDEFYYRNIKALITSKIKIRKTNECNIIEKSYNIIQEHLNKDTGSNQSKWVNHSNLARPDIAPPTDSNLNLQSNYNVSGATSADNLSHREQKTEKTPQYCTEDNRVCSQQTSKDAITPTDLCSLGYPSLNMNSLPYLRPLENPGQSTYYHISLNVDNSTNSICTTTTTTTSEITNVDNSTNNIDSRVTNAPHIARAQNVQIGDRNKQQLSSLGNVDPTKDEDDHELD